MIFATVGTTHFDALTRCLDEAVGKGLVTDEVLLQIGHGGDYTPRYCRYFKIAPTLEVFEQAADLVIGHGGTGTTFEILRLGKPLISVANPLLQDNHQHEFLSALERRGLVRYCRDLNQLPEMIARGVTSFRQVHTSSRLPQTLSELIQSMHPHQESKHKWLRRLANRFARRYEIDKTTTRRSSTSHVAVWKLIVDPRSSPSLRITDKTPDSPTKDVEPTILRP